MNHGTKIEWTHFPGYKGETWNPVRGCTRVSEGCRNCYAEIMAARFSKPGKWGHGFAEMRGGDHRWTGKVELVESQLELPLRWKKPRAIFVNSTSDLFHERLHDETIDRVFGVMAMSQQHIFIVLTKRPKRMATWFSDGLHRAARVFDAAERLDNGGCFLAEWPLQNVILGVSVEDQATADERIPHLLATPAAVRMVSAEPLLGPVDFVRWLPICRVTTSHPDREATAELRLSKKDGPHIDWIVTGGESGPGARPMDHAWARSIRDQCTAAGVPFFFKQWGGWLPIGQTLPCFGRVHGGTAVKPGRMKLHSGGTPKQAPKHAFSERGVEFTSTADGLLTFRVGKKDAGRLLDGREHNEFPAIGARP